MRTSIATTRPPPSPLVRRITLATAFLLAMAVWLAPRTPTANAQAGPANPAVPPAPKAAPVPGKPAANTEERASTTIDIHTDESGKKTVTIQKSGPRRELDAEADAADTVPPNPASGPGKHGKHVTVGIFGDDREYDSFSDFVHSEPALFAMIVAIVAIIFLSPVLAIALILGYRMRKARMLNETMLRLAEKGAVLPAEALGALTAGSANTIAATPATASYYEQAKQLRQRAASSDLRKGMIMSGIGIGLTMFSMLDDGTPNGLGLVLLFVGIGYTVLWWFEQRQMTPAMGPAAPGPTTAAPSDGRSGSA